MVRSAMPVVTHTGKPFVWKRPPPSDLRQALRLTSGGHRYDVRLIGLINRSRFLVTHPVQDGKLVFVKEGEPIDVATFDGAVLYAFGSSVKKVLLGESALELHLPAPEERKREVVRRTRRAAVALPCSLRYGAHADQVRAGFVGDLSHQGAQVALEAALPADLAAVDLGFRLEVLGETLTVQTRASIRSSGPDPRPDVSAVLYGLQFTEMDRAQQVAVSHFVFERLLALHDDAFAAIR